MNNLKVFLLMIAMMAIMVTIGYLFAGEVGMLWAFVGAAIMNVVTYWKSDKLILLTFKAREVSPSDGGKPAQLYGIVQEMTTLQGYPMPKVYIVPDKAPNAFATGRNAEHAAVAATEGMLELLSRDELKAVMGHELAHIQNRDMLIGTIAATFVSAIGILAMIARFSAIFGGYGRSNDRGGGLGLLITALLAPIMAMILQTAISRQREYKADAEGGRLAGGRFTQLADALQKIHSNPVRMNLDSKPGAANLMFANPLSGKSFTRLFSTHPPIEKRIGKLQKLAHQSAMQGYVG